MFNQEVKGTLARLLATENLTVEHRKVSTAYFDVDKRVLCLPIWKTASETVYDLLVGHEVGHALYTPQEGLGDAPKAFVNVLEDVRIEKMMKETYPGLRKSFFDGYRELWSKDFFGVAGEDVEELPFIDRINLYYKGNSTIEFTDEERVYVERAIKTKTFEDVLELARDLYGKAQKEEDAKPENLDDLSLDSKDGDDKEDDPNSDGELEVNNNGDQDGESDQKKPVDEMTDQELLDELFPQEPTGGTEYKETESVTDQAFAEALETLVDDDTRDWKYLRLPKVNIDKIITPPKKIADDLQRHFEAQKEDQRHEVKDYPWRADDESGVEYAEKHFNEYKKSAQKTVNYLVKQFEMKKSAEQYKRAAVSKTGVINTNSLYKYKLTDDIFKKITTVPDGKNHGLVMFLDWSGSMSTTILDTLKQTYNLVWFCKKVNIPFRVIAFQSGHCGGYYGDTYQRFHAGVKVEEDTLAIGSDFTLLEFFSSRQSKRDLDQSMKYVYLQAFSFNGWRTRQMNDYSLGGTPLAEAVYCAREVVAKMKKEEQVSKVNVVCLTDGESNPMAHVARRHGDASWSGASDENELTIKSTQYSHAVYIVRDPVTGYQRVMNMSPYQTTAEIVSFMREITDYNWIGIRICSKSEVSRVFRNFLSYDQEEMQRVDRQWKKERFASIKKKAGFTEAFYIPNQGLGGETLDLEVKTKGEVATRAELGRAFKKHMGSKMTNKTILNAFIEQIA